MSDVDTDDADTDDASVVLSVLVQVNIAEINK